MTKEMTDASRAMLAECRPREGLRLDELAREIPGGAEVLGDASMRVYGVHHDSRRVEPGDLFVARKGQNADGARFAEQAKERGAVAILTGRHDDAATFGLPALLVDDVPFGFAHASAAIYGHPSFSLEVVGVTGTNGKTTTTHLIRAAIDGATGSEVCGTIGTVGHAFRDFWLDAAHTTPEADELARVMAMMRKRGATHVAMEVSSIALALGRVRAVRFRVAAFTNLTQDHLDFHKTMEAYGAEKAALFTTYAPGGAVICVDSPYGAELAKRVRSPVVRVSAEIGKGGELADIAPTQATLDARGIDATLRTPDGPMRIRSLLVGRHNLENIVVAVGVIHALGLDVARACEAMGKENGAPGRLERCDGPGDDITVLVDYAHTPDALARVLASVRSVTKGRILCVFGCGGDRDPTKRGPMGEAVALGADMAVITNDNPRSEDPKVIAAPIEAALVARGMQRAQHFNDPNVSSTMNAFRSYVVELDRSEAIRIAVRQASAGDVVLIAGKGHEDYQIVGSEKLPFDDRVEARRALASRGGGAR